MYQHQIKVEPGNENCKWISFGGREEDQSVYVHNIGIKTIPFIIPSETGRLQKIKKTTSASPASANTIRRRRWRFERETL